ncbi:hypothetical protein SteCoe_969 [Stentor coeruleus]|uniref:Bromo domain-containing protein n=1 Tax=Stentor coeruleus TaxID=5963 RepID=A0A1R2D2T9_9CILI|nr:hypothetical protein SteCoe_969 [Stentor coeruleus]
MEYTQTHITMINILLPPRYKIEVASKSESRPVTVMQRKSEAENLDFNVRFQPKIPEKRPSAEQSYNLNEIPESKAKQNEGFKKLWKILTELKKHPKINSFLSVPDKRSNPEYFEKIKNPMDINTIEKKLLNAEFETGYQFALDIRQIWNNSFFYNSGKQDVYSATLELSMFFEKIMKGNDDVILTDQKVMPLDQKKIEKQPSKNPKLQQNLPEAIPVTSAPKLAVKQIPEKPLGFLEKKQLCQNIKKLEPKYLKGVLDIVKECTDTKGEELEFDIDKLPPKVCRDLDRYVKNCLQNINRSQKKIKPNTADIINRSQETTQSKIQEVSEKISNLNTFKKPEEPVSQVDESESESSSTSESEEDDDEIPGTGNMSGYGFNGRDNGPDFRSSPSGAIDIENIY